MTDPKFQYSEFVRNGHDGQYVVRTDDKEEFEQLVTYIQSKIHPEAQTVVPNVAPPDLSIDGEKGQGGKCPLHGSPLVWKTGTSKTTNKPYAFWSCPTLNPDGTFCRAAAQRKI